MDAISQNILEQLSGDSLSRIGDEAGIDASTAGSALSVILPTLVSALSKNAADPNGAEALHSALARDHDGSLLDNLGGLLGGELLGDGAGILGHILGGKRENVETGLSKGTGLDAATIAKLLQIAAPIVLAYLGRRQQEQSLDPGGLSSYLGEETKPAAEADSGVMGAVTNMLDSNDDGSVVDDLARMAGNLFKR